MWDIEKVLHDCYCFLYIGALMDTQSAQKALYCKTKYTVYAVYCVNSLHLKHDWKTSCFQ